MSKSAAKKHRDRLIREGKRDVALSRGSWNGVRPDTRVVPNKKKEFTYRERGYDRALKKA